MREAAVNSINNDWRYFVEPLVKVILHEDQDLITAIRRIAKLEELTDKRFTYLPPFEEVATWWQSTGSWNVTYYYPLVLEQLQSELPAKSTIGELTTLLESKFESKLKDKKGLCRTHYMLANLYKALGDTERIKQHLLPATSECDEPVEGFFWLAEIYVGEDQNEKAVALLKRIKPHVPDFNERVSKASFYGKLQDVNSFQQLLRE